MMTDITTPTRKRLTLAFTKLKREAQRDGKLGPSICAVAREAGVSHTLIHNKYSDIAEKIRDANGKGPKQLLEKQRTLVEQAEDRVAELRTDLAALKTQNQGLASKNARLILLVKHLEKEIASLEQGAVKLRPQRIGGHESDA